MQKIAWEISWDNFGAEPRAGFIFSNELSDPMNLEALAGMSSGRHSRKRNQVARLACIPTLAHDQSAQTRSFRQGDSTNSASRERHDDDQHSREDGEHRCGKCDEGLGNNVCSYCATRETGKYANYVEILSLGNQQPSMLGRVT